ncbi:hypothetical protein MMC11_003776 [Xylographa trunciseda]|nr:hypothetical protein [Xylographa trunciseda]
MLFSRIIFVSLNTLCVLSFPAFGSNTAIHLNLPTAALQNIVHQYMVRRVPSQASALGLKKPPETPKNAQSNSQPLTSPSISSPPKDSALGVKKQPETPTITKSNSQPLNAPHTSSPPKQNDPNTPNRGSKGKGPSRKDTSQPSITPDTIITTNEGDVTVKSRLINFTGCSAAQTTSINNAFVDALRLANAVGNPDLIFKGSLEPLAIYDYYGRKNDRAEVESRISDNWKRAQLPNTQWKFGDWWFQRYIDIHCDDPWGKVDPTQGCITGSWAYEAEPNTPQYGNPTDHPAISLCPKFFPEPTLDARIQEISDGVWADNDVRNLVCQGSLFLHEMFHMALRYPGSTNPNIDPGISNPRCIDKEVRGLKGKAYGPARAKYLVRLTDVGALAGSVNNDNYVFFAISLFMKNTWNIEYPIYPMADWPPDDPSSDAGIADPSPVPNGPLYSDQDFYGDVYTPPQSQSQAPATPTPNPTGTPLQKITCSSLPPGPRVTGPHGATALQPAMCGCSDGSKHMMEDPTGKCW